MNTGISFPKAPPNRQTDGTQTIDSGLFWPRINLDNLRQVMRVDTTVPPERLYELAIEAVAYVNDQLKPFARRAAASGHQSMAQIDAPQINGESICLHRYRRAVYCYTKSLLLEAYADYDATGKTAARAEAKQEQAEDYRCQGHHAVADLLGRRRIDSELV